MNARSPDGLVYCALVLALTVAIVSTRAWPIAANPESAFTPGMSFEAAALMMTNIDNTQVAVGP